MPHKQIAMNKAVLPGFAIHTHLDNRKGVVLAEFCLNFFDRIGCKPRIIYCGSESKPLTFTNADEFLEFSKGYDKSFTIADTSSGCIFNYKAIAVYYHEVNVLAISTSTVSFDKFSLVVRDCLLRNALPVFYAYSYLRRRDRGVPLYPVGFLALGSGLALNYYDSDELTRWREYIWNRDFSKPFKLRFLSRDLYVDKHAQSPFGIFHWEMFSKFAMIGVSIENIGDNMIKIKLGRSFLLIGRLVMRNHLI